MSVTALLSIVTLCCLAVSLADERFCFLGESADKVLDRIYTGSIIFLPIAVLFEEWL